MKYIAVLGLIVILASCRSTKDSQRINNDVASKLITKEDSVKYFINKGINYSVEEKLLPVYKHKIDSLNNLK